MSIYTHCRVNNILCVCFIFVSTVTLLVTKTMLRDLFLYIVSHSSHGSCFIIDLISNILCGWVGVYSLCGAAGVVYTSRMQSMWGRANRYAQTHAHAHSHMHTCSYMLTYTRGASMQPSALNYTATYVYVPPTVYVYMHTGMPPVI